MSVRCAMLCGAALALPATAQAQAQGAPTPALTSGVLTYLPADFARFAPQNALDMVRQVPGFVIETAEERRGLGQATQNVLIDGKRISGKSNDAEAALGRINARDVLRIEILDGATLDVPGLSGQVANILTAVKGLTGNFRYNPQIRARRTEARLLDGEISLSGKSGAFDYTLSLSDEQQRGGNAGPERVTDGAGRLIDLRHEVLIANEDSPRLSGALKYQGAGGGIGNLNASIAQSHSLVAENSRQGFPGTVDRRRDYRETEKEWNYEIGGDYEFGLGGGRLKLIGLRRFEHSPSLTRVFFEYGDGRPDTCDLFARTADESEAIARTEYRWKGGVADWQVSLEGAFNTLDNRSTLAVLDTAGVYQPVPLEGGNAKVKEKRVEIALSYGRPLSGALTLQSAIGAEYSNITQNGAGGLNRNFLRPKGFVSLAWKASPRFDISAKIEREVGQLDFYDFVASVNLAGGNGNAGNPDLRPPQSWNVELTANRNLGAWGSIKLKTFAKFIADAVAQVPIGATGEAPGNISKARLVGLDLTGTINLDPAGWRGARVDINTIFRKSRLHDPLTDEIRELSEQDKSTIDVNFRHDIPGSDLAWGVDYSRYIQTAGFRLDQTSQYVEKPGDLGAYLEHKDVFGLKLRGGLSNLLGMNERFYRSVYEGRRTDPIAFTEDRSRYFGPVFDVRISGSF
ncbi:TonB-dependent receptor plug domain-containing protein [Sphingobium boeckii]|uniref:TonB-dependent receptor n=1 Tax=Sphingobium boeckii TaxID=1082345 RepID=A0A7W9ECN5_9SPHN|nr:TonB-dependent receptor [Sphingobium boeckii]MBB5684242.1 hypothetical protein [Sphingobium boeckii]